MRILWVGVVASAVLMGCGAGPASPTEPDVGTDQSALTTHVREDFNISYTNEFFGQCPNGDILVNGADISGTQSIYFTDGTPTQVVINAMAWGSVTNTRNGKMLSDAPDPLHITFNLVSGQTTIIGLHFHILAPKYGIILLEAGRSVIDAAGNTTFSKGIARFDVNKLCAALQ